MVKFTILKYKFQHWMFQWITDEDGDIGIQIMGVLSLIKYKEHTLIKFGFNKFKPAGKYQGYNSEKE